jgi:uncharacterized protein YkwD
LLSLKSLPRETSAQNLVGAKASAAATLEPEIVTELNLARTRPAEYATYLEQLRPLFSGKEYTPPGRTTLLTQEGVPALEEAISFLRAAKPVRTLSLSQGMCSGARELVKDQSVTGSTGHKGLDGSFCEQRTQRFGSWKDPIGENLTYGNDTARERVMLLLIDDGFPSRGHRRRIFDPSFNVVGVACGEHKLGAMCVITLAGGFTDGTKAAQPTRKTTTISAGAKRF